MFLTMLPIFAASRTIADDTYPEPQDPQITLITGWYAGRTKRRYHENLACLCCNIQNRHIAEVVLMQDKTFGKKNQEALRETLERECPIILKEMADGVLTLEDTETKKLQRLGIPEKVQAQIGETEDFFFVSDKREIKKAVEEKLVFHITKDSQNKGMNMLAVFEYTNKFLADKLVAVANLDVFLDETLDEVLYNGGLRPDAALFLSRHEALPHTQKASDWRKDGFSPRASFKTQCSENFAGSHDVFIFNAPLKSHKERELKSEHLTEKELKNEHLTEEELKSISFGSWGIESAVAFYFKKMLGMTISNPCKRILVWHMHSVRGKGEEIKRPKNKKLTGIVLPRPDHLKPRHQFSSQPCRQFPRQRLSPYMQPSLYEL
ncbi:MAG: uncharacterized protein A8A55_1582 [Amphiamblys sp. WSBS2006]|nr:MAG: uncharacterized protein A8A55_1582 [Amphiamblys sp. WSBS2006]